MREIRKYYLKFGIFFINQVLRYFCGLGALRTLWAVGPHTHTHTWAHTHTLASELSLGWQSFNIDPFYYFSQIVNDEPVELFFFSYANGFFLMFEHLPETIYWYYTLLYFPLIRIRSWLPFSRKQNNADGQTHLEFSTHLNLEDVKLIFDSFEFSIIFGSWTRICIRVLYFINM